MRDIMVWYVPRDWIDPWSKACQGRGRASAARDAAEWLDAYDLFDEDGDWSERWCDGYCDCDCAECYERPAWIDTFDPALGQVFDLDEIRRRRAVAALSNDGS